MKRFTLLAIVLLMTAGISFAQTGDVIPLSEPVEIGENYEVYGSEFPDDAQYFGLGYLIRNSKVFTGQKVATTGTIKQVCQRKGCFFILEVDEYTARVTFKDYRFFIPTDAAGAKVNLVGIFTEKKFTEKQKEYYSEDVGEDLAGDRGEGMEYNIVASSVKIKEKPSS